MSFLLPDNMPELNLGIPTERDSIGSVELNPDLLRHWIKELPKNNIGEFIQLYRNALKRFNLNQLDIQQRLTLLDLYRAPLNKLLFELTLDQLAKHIPELKNRNKIIDSLAELMSELAIGFKIAIMDSGKSNSHLKMNPLGLLAVNRAGEQLNYMALHAYKFHRAVPARIFHELHQLYQLTMAADIEHNVPVIDQELHAESSFKQLYSQIMLVSISNPYGLKAGDILNAYHLMEQLADETEISPLPLNAKATAGHFYINCLSDGIPTPSVLPVLDNQTQPPALVLNTKPVLAIVDSLFQQPKNDQDPTQEREKDLLKALIPYLNTSYERKQPRTEITTGSKQAYIATGLTAVHQCLNKVRSLPDNTIPDLSIPWDILNKNNSGYLLCRQNVIDHQQMTIGDFIGIFESNPKGKVLARIAFIRWMKTSHSGKTKIGLSLIEGEPVSVHYTLDSDNFQPALLLPEINRIRQAASLITAPDVFSTDRILTVRPKKKLFQFSMAIAQLLNKGNDYEHFSLSESDFTE